MILVWGPDVKDPIVEDVIAGSYVKDSIAGLGCEECYCEESYCEGLSQLRFAICDTHSHSAISVAILHQVDCCWAATI